MNIPTQTTNRTASTRLSLVSLCAIALAGCASRSDVAAPPEDAFVNVREPRVTSTPARREARERAEAKIPPAASAGAEDPTSVSGVLADASIASAMAPSVASLEDEWGIRVVGLRLTAGGRMLDFRYRVIDAEKALPVFSRKEKPRLVESTTGTTLGVPTSTKIGPLRNSDKPIEGRDFFILFGNAGGVVKRGSRVSVVVGDFKLEDLVVQ